MELAAVTPAVQVTAKTLLEAVNTELPPRLRPASLRGVVDGNRLAVEVFDLESNIGVFTLTNGGVTDQPLSVAGRLKAVLGYLEQIAPVRSQIPKEHPKCGAYLVLAQAIAKSCPHHPVVVDLESASIVRFTAFKGLGSGVGRVHEACLATTIRLQTNGTWVMLPEAERLAKRMADVMNKQIDGVQA